MMADSRTPALAHGRRLRRRLNTKSRFGCGA